MYKSIFEKVYDGDRIVVFTESEVNSIIDEAFLEEGYLSEGDTDGRRVRMLKFLFGTGVLKKDKSGKVVYDDKNAKGALQKVKGALKKVVKKVIDTFKRKK